MVNRSQARQSLRMFWGKAEEVLRHTSLLLKLLDEAGSKFKANSNVLRKVGDDFKTLCRLIRAWATGQYTNVPWKVLLMAVSATIYFVNPLDIIPDFLLGGLVDDITVITYVIAALKTEIDEFKAWESRS